MGYCRHLPVDSAQKRSQRLCTNTRKYSHQTRNIFPRLAHEGYVQIQENTIIKHVIFFLASESFREAVFNKFEKKNKLKFWKKCLRTVCRNFTALCYCCSDGPSIYGKQYAQPKGASLLVYPPPPPPPPPRPRLSKY